MNEYRKRLMPNVYLTVLPARKFKTGCLSAQFITALDRDRASYNALLPAVLNRGTMRYPDMESLFAAMDTLYGTTITTTVRKNGERQCVGFVASCIDDRFAPGGEKLLEPMAELVGELFLDPVTRGGHYLKEYVDSEKVNLIDSIRAIRNDKRDWANLRLLQEMCAGEPYGVSRLGDESSAQKITTHTLYTASSFCPMPGWSFCIAAALSRSGWRRRRSRPLPPCPGARWSSCRPCRPSPPRKRPASSPRRWTSRRASSPWAFAAAVTMSPPWSWQT